MPLANGQHAEHSDDGGQMVDAVDPHRVGEPAPGQDVGLVEGKTGVVGETGDVLDAPGAQVVDGDDPVAFVQVVGHEIGADESRAAGDQDLHMLPREKMLVALSLRQPIQSLEIYEISNE